MHAILMRVDVFSCHVFVREDKKGVRTFYTVRLSPIPGREMMVDGRLSYGGIYSLQLRKNRIQSQIKFHPSGIFL